MNYSDIISRGFRSLKSGGIWGFIATTYGAILAVFVIAVLFGLVAVEGFASFGAIRSALESSATPPLGIIQALLVFCGLLVLAALIAIPIGLIAYGGLIHLTDEFHAGRAVRVGDGWRFGARRMGRVFLLEFVFGIIGTGLLLLGVAPFVLAIIGASRAGSPGPAVVIGVCGGGLLTLVFIAAFVALSGVESLSIRYALVGDRHTGDAIGSGWKAFTARFGSVLALILILFAFGIVAGLIQSAVNGVIQFFTIGTTSLSSWSSSSERVSAAGVGGMVVGFGLIYTFSFVLQLALRILQVSMWTAFFRQMTGLDVGVAASGYARPPYPVAGGPGMTPSAPRYPSGPPMYQPPAQPTPPAPPRPPAPPAPPGQPAPPAPSGQPTAPPLTEPPAVNQWQPPMAGPDA